jgi:hypothetical protein
MSLPVIIQIIFLRKNRKVCKLQGKVFFARIVKVICFVAL